MSVTQDVVRASSTRFVLINAAQVHASYWDDLQPLPLVPEAHRSQAAFLPVLVDCHAIDDAQRKRLQERMRAWERETDTPYALAWLNGSASASTVRTHLIRRMSVRRPDGREDVLRYYDPWVFRHLRGWLLTSDQMDSLLGPVDTWHWREPDGTWRVYTRQCEMPSLRPLRLTPQQWPSLQRMAELHLALTTLARTDPMLAWSWQTAQQIDVLLGDARLRYRMDDRADRLLYALQAVRFHPAIHRHPRLQHRLGRLGDDGLTYVESCADLDDTRMQQFVCELESMKTTSR